jgi:hypothetical protein
VKHIGSANSSSVIACSQVMSTHCRSNGLESFNHVARHPLDPLGPLRRDVEQAPVLDQLFPDPEHSCLH